MAIRVQGRAHSFASMIGLAGKRAEDEPREVEDDAKKGRRAEEEDEDAQKGRRAEDEDGKKGRRAEDEPRDRGARKAAEDDEDEHDCPECEGTGEDDEGEACEACDGTGKVEDDEAKKGKKSKARKATRRADEEDGDAKAVKAERRRWGVVMAQAIKSGKATAACALLHDTPMSAAKILDTLEALPADNAPRALNLSERMRGQAQPSIGPAGPGAHPGDSKSEASALAARMIGAHNKALGLDAAK